MKNEGLSGWSVEGYRFEVDDPRDQTLLRHQPSGDTSETLHRRDDLKSKVTIKRQC